MIAKWLKYAVLIALCTNLSFPLHLSAQKTVFQFTNLSTDQGLNVPNVLKVLQDKQGYIWVATQHSLYRYDGYQFKRFKHDPDDPYSLADIYINSIYVDRKGVLWVGTDGGLAQYNAAKESFTNYFHQPNKPDSLSNNIVMSIVEDDAGSIWVATLGGGLNRFDRVKKTFTHFRHALDDPESISSDNLYTVINDSKGVLWVGTRNAGLNRFDKKKGIFKRYQHEPDNPDSLSHNKVYDLLEDEQGAFWIATRGGGLNRLDRKTGLFQHFRHDPNNIESLSSDEVFSIFSDNVGSLWVGTDKSGLNRLDKINNTFERYQHNPQDKKSLADDDVYSITQDQTGLIWLGTLGGGISKFDPASERFGLVKHDATESHGLSKGVVWALLKDKSGILWVGTDTGLNRYDPKTKQFTLYQHEPKNMLSLSDSDVRSLFEDDSGNLWVGTSKGGLNILIKSELDGINDVSRPLRFEHYRNQIGDETSLSDNHVSVIHQSIEGDMWIGTQNGLNRFNQQTKQFTRFKHSPKSDSSISQNDINALYTTQDGSLWVGTLGGLNKFETETQSFTRYQHEKGNPNSLSHNSINAVIEDEKGILWLSTSGGLNKFNPKTNSFKHYRVKEGMLSDRVFAVLIDDNGKLWIGENGISFFDPETEVFKNHIGEEAGCVGVNQGAFFKANDGKMFFGNHGYCAFYPQNAIRESFPPNVVLTDFRLRNKSMPIKNKKPDSPLTNVLDQSESITLKHSDNVLSFEFAALHYTAPKANKFRYKLENFDDNWVTTSSDNRRATYTNLSPGKYTFRVNASNNENLWNKNERSIDLIILPPVWLTWWAYSLYFLLLAGGLILFIRLQQKKVIQARFLLKKENELVQRLKRLDRLKDDILTNTSHELRTPLGGILGLSESMLYEDSSEVSEEVKGNLQLIVNCGLRLSHLINDLLDFQSVKLNAIKLHTQAIDIRLAVDTTLAMLNILVKDKEIQLLNQVSSNLPPVEADDSRLQQILFNLIGNAIKFTPSGFVKVTAELDNKFVKISIIDSGIGIPLNRQTDIFESFRQLDSSATREYQGIGLGLSISKKLIERHSGTISVTSDINQGSIFTFSLPVSLKSLQ